MVEEDFISQPIKELLIIKNDNKINLQIHDDDDFNFNWNIIREKLHDFDNGE